MPCPVCGYELDPRDQDCPRCIRLEAHRLLYERQGTSTIPSPASIPSQRARHAGRHPQYWTFAVLALLLPLVGIILGIIKLVDKDPDERALGVSTMKYVLLSLALMVLLIIGFFTVGTILYRAPVNLG